MFLLFLGYYPSFSFLSPMLSISKVRALCPSVSFLFARLGGSLGAFPYLENFVLEGSGLSVALGDFFQLLRQLIDRFESLISE